MTSTPSTIEVGQTVWVVAYDGISSPQVTEVTATSFETSDGRTWTRCAETSAGVIGHSMTTTVRRTREQAIEAGRRSYLSAYERASERFDRQMASIARAEQGL